MEKWSIMPERKSKRVYYFSVEGQCERLYLMHLKRLINSIDESKFKVDFIVKTERPKSYVKGLVILDKTQIYHMQDVETKDYDAINSFMKTIDDINAAGKMGKKVKYSLIYSNLSFEVWILWHKSDFRQKRTFPRDYIQDIDRAYGTDFKNAKEYKTEENFNKLLNLISIEDVRNAVKRSEKIMQNYDEHEDFVKYKNQIYCLRDPSTNMGIKIKNILIDCGLY